MKCFRETPELYVPSALFVGSCHLCNSAYLLERKRVCLFLELLRFESPASPLQAAAHVRNQWLIYRCRWAVHPVTWDFAAGEDLGGFLLFCRESSISEKAVSPDTKSRETKVARLGRKCIECEG